MKTRGVTSEIVFDSRVIQNTDLQAEKRFTPGDELAVEIEIRAIHFAQVDVYCSPWTRRDHIIQLAASIIHGPCRSSTNGSPLRRVVSGT